MPEAREPAPAACAPTLLRSVSVGLAKGTPEAARRVEDLVARLRPALVQLFAPMPRRHAQAPLRALAGDPFEITRAGPLGTGVLVGRKLVLTAGHVVDRTSDVRVRLHGGRELPATLVGRSLERDLALLELGGSPGALVAAAIRDEPPRAGEWLVALGNLYGAGPTAALGVVTSASGDSTGDAETVETDLAVNITNTGGPLVDLEGRVVGIANAKLTEARGMRGLGYGTAARAAFSLLANATTTDAPLRTVPTPDRSPLRGVTTDELRPDLRRLYGIREEIGHGAVAVGVESTSPAASVGIEPGDVFVEVDFAPIWSADAFVDASREASGPLLVLVVRGNSAAYVLLRP